MNIHMCNISKTHSFNTIEFSQIYFLLLVKIKDSWWNSKHTLSKWNKTLACLLINAWINCDHGEFFLWIIFFNGLYLSMNYVFKWCYIVSVCRWSILCNGKYFKLNTSHLALPRWMFPLQAWLAVETDMRVCHGCFDSPVILIQGSDPCGLSIILLTLQREQHSRHWTVNR